MTVHAKLSACTGIPVHADSLAYEIKFVKPPQKGGVAHEMRNQMHLK